MGQSDKPEEPPAPEVRANQVRSSLGAPVIGLRLPPDLLETWWERRSSCTASDRSFSATAHRVAISCFQHAPAPNRRQHCKKRPKADQHRRLLAVSTDIRAVSATASIWSLAASMLVSRPW